MSSLSGAMDLGILWYSFLGNESMSGLGVNLARLFLLRAFGVRLTTGLTSSSLTVGSEAAATEDAYAISFEGHTVVP